MKVGLSIHRLYRFGYDPTAYAAIARRAEQLGFDSLWIGDHLTFPETLPNTYPYSKTGRGPHDAGMPWLDPWITMTYLAAATEKILLATDIYILPLRDPFVTAKAVSTLDILSRGRTVLGVGIGWCGPEYDAVGQAFENRGSRCDELIDAIKALWTQETITFKGKHYAFGPVKFEPKPVQRPHPPIIYGGNAPKALERTARQCDGWIEAPQSFEEMQHCIKTIQELRKRYGRDHLPFEITKGLAWPVAPADLQRYVDAGVDRITIAPWIGPSGEIPLSQALEEMEQAADALKLKRAI